MEVDKRFTIRVTNTQDNTSVLHENLTKEEVDYLSWVPHLKVEVISETKLLKREVNE